MAKFETTIPHATLRTLSFENLYLQHTSIGMNQVDFVNWIDRWIVTLRYLHVFYSCLQTHTHLILCFSQIVCIWIPMLFVILAQENKPPFQPCHADNGVFLSHITLGFHPKREAMVSLYRNPHLRKLAGRVYSHNYT